MEELRWDWTSEAEVGEEAVETLIIRRLVVLGIMPKRRKDSAIWQGVSGKDTRKEPAMAAKCKRGRVSKEEGKRLEEAVNIRYCSETEKTQFRNEHFYSVSGSLIDR